MSIDLAIAQLEEQVAGFQQGTKAQPRDGSTEWFVLRALALGLTHLKRMRQLGVAGDHAAAERFYRHSGRLFKQLNVPDPVLVDREVLPDGTLPTGDISG